MNIIFEQNFLNENMMGPNVVKLLDELLAVNEIQLKPYMRVMDLGCGKGLTSIALAKQYNVTVFAVDLWITATENFQRFQTFFWIGASCPYTPTR